MRLGNHLHHLSGVLFGSVLPIIKQTGAFVHACTVESIASEFLLYRASFAMVMAAILVHSLIDNRFHCAPKWPPR